MDQKSASPERATTGKSPVPEPAAAGGVRQASSRHAPLGFAAFVVLIAGLMGLNAIATDIMLPGLPQISAAFGLSDPNAIQTIITAYLLGFGIGQLVMGFLADRYGRKPVLLWGLAVYGIGAALCALAPDMPTLLAARFLQGAGSASPRVIATAAIRDCYEGRPMARVMSLSMTVFMAVPVMAPSIGQLILFAASWRAVFAFLVLYAGTLLVLCFLFLPETLRPEYRRPIRIPEIRAALASIFGSRQTVGYMLASGSFFGAMFGFINSAQQIMVGVLGFGEWFPLAFALIALGIAASAFINSMLVERIGMRILSHAATSLFLVASLAMLVLSETGNLTAWVFVPLLSLSMLLVGMVFGNFNALAMVPQGHVAGVASSMIGSITVLLGATVGYLIGQAFDGTITPLAIGYTLSSAGTLVVLFVTERGRLFRPGGPE